MKFNLIFSVILCFCTLAVFAATPVPATQIVHDFYAAVDAGDFDKAATLLSDDVMVYIPFSPQAMDKKAYKQLGMGMKAGFPDMQHKILDVSEGKGTVAFKGLFIGTNTASLQGNPPTGNRVEAPFLGFLKLDKKGKISEVNIQFDVTSFNAQLMKGLDPTAMAKKSISELFEAMDAGQTDKFANYCAPGFTISNPFLPGPSPIEAFQGIIQGQKAGFPDMKHEVMEMVVEGGSIVTKGIFEGTNTGSMMGNPPTGNRVELPFLVLDKVDAQGKLTSRFVQFDSKSFEAQLMKGINPGAATEANKKAALKIMEDLDKRDLDGVCAAFAPGAKLSGWTPQPVDVNGYRAAMSELLAAFPDSRFTVDAVIAEGDKVVVRHHLTGTHTGAKFQGTAVSRKKVFASATVTFQFQNGKPVEVWLNADSLGLLLQIGAIPPPQN